MFWKKKDAAPTPKRAAGRPTAKADDGKCFMGSVSMASSAPVDYDLAQFGIKTVSDKDVQADLAKLMAEIQSDTSMDGINLGDSDDEEAAIMREIQKMAPSANLQHALSLGSNVSDDMGDSDVDVDDPLLNAELHGLLGTKPPSIESERQRLQALVDLERTKALELKRQGLVPEALAAMREMKAYQAQLDSLLLPEVDSSAPEVHTVVDDNSSLQVPDDDTNNPGYDTLLHGASSTPRESLLKQAKKLRTEIHAQKLDALALKRENRVPEALAVFRNVKVLEASLAELEASLVAAPEEAPAIIAEEVELPPMVDDNEDVQVTDEDLDDPSFDAELANLHKPAPASTVTTTTTTRTPTTMHTPQVLETSLSDQIAAAKALAVQLKRDGRIPEALEQLRRAKALEATLVPETTTPGPSPAEVARLQQYEAVEKALVDAANASMHAAKDLLATDRAQAMAQVEQRKYYTTALETLREARRDPLQPPPTLEVVRETRLVEHVNSAVRPDAIVVAIPELRSTSPEAKDVFVKFSLNVPSSNPHEGVTPSAHGSSSVKFGAEFTFPIARSRGLQKLVELRKAQFEVLTTAGFWKASESLGRGSLNLAPLVKTSEINCWVPLMANRRPCGVDIHVILRLRTPLGGPEMRPVHSEKLVVGPYPPREVPAAVPEPPVIPAVSLVVPAVAPVEGPTTSVALPNDETDPHSLDNIVSYEVMTDEVERITKRLEAGAVPELVDRLESLQLKRQLFEIEIQSGKLSLEMYVARLQERIALDNQLARSLYKQGQKGDAARVMLRVKMMTKELESA
ncbi:hypothetical protein SPRG_06035 [Saprolegnia parasitica CBS 223.65]|uniref:C2 domain-containing protein n=1 Tax=Saprolegnia parasitica (strain CBS 223.65) TaxID=695850 RepID=A0A067CJX2_SAPPC|nr:hypothetical protein SPRG_06035 [Saprolegnia parasitica CBS 223.65]KDO29495.1 hypothetical protein SPRG_06035 [Saprolegnia parasitica CBS 223.65]|eukprot:XP_012199991.1 hypothetical protein SPRG_06035 [Saprolegnia parasitica CBS 223.65]